MTNTPPADPVLALSLWRPWPFCIFYLGKPVENRSWSTRYTGTLILHAGRIVETDLAENLVAAGHPRASVLAQGFIGVVTVTGCHPAAECRGRCSPTWAADDGFHWQLADPRPFPQPIPGPGRQRLFSAPPDAATMLKQELR